MPEVTNVELTQDHVFKFVTRINANAWNWNLHDFCRATGLPLSNYGQDKFLALNRLQSALSEFDLQTLCVLAGIPKNA